MFGRPASCRSVPAMTTIFVDGSAASLPDAPNRLAHLTEAGHPVVLVAAPDHRAAATVAWSSHVPELPSDPPRGSWFVTADPATCGDRQAGLATLLIGPREESPRPTRCDMTARDMASAILEILARDAMH
jgi:hypothetical protein